MTLGDGPVPGAIPAADPAPPSAQAADDDQESEKERQERNFSDLLQELRVAQAGVQILFAFLLTMVFSARFGDIDAFDRAAYLTALLSAAVAVSLLIAPVAYHRVLFRRGRKEQLVRSAHRMASAGLAFLLISMVSSLLLVLDVLLVRWTAIGISALAGAWFALLWLVLPLKRRDDTDDAL